MYVSASAPLPQNSLMAPPAWQVARSKAEVARLNLQVARSLIEYECGLNPGAYADFGPAVVGQVAQANQLVNLAGQNPQSLQTMADSTISSGPDQNPPQVIPFNPIRLSAPPLNPKEPNPLNINSPAWNDALASSMKACPTGVQSWIAQHPGLTLLIGAIAAAALAGASSGRRGR